MGTSSNFVGDTEDGTANYKQMNGWGGGCCGSLYVRRIYLFAGYHNYMQLGTEELINSSVWHKGTPSFFKKIQLNIPVLRGLKTKVRYNLPVPTGIRYAQEL